MSQLGPESLHEVLSACEAGLDQAAAALERALGQSFALSVAGSGTLDAFCLPTEMECAGLALVLTVGSQAMLVLLPDSAGLLPEWCLAPDDSQAQALADLAQELGSLWLPPMAPIENAEAAHLPSLAEAVLRGRVQTKAAHIRLRAVGAGGQPSELSLIWPAADPAAVLNTSLNVQSLSESSPSARPQTDDAKSGPRVLPSYIKSLLNISVPVTVTLAAQRLPLARIVELGPGSLLQFEKSCEELLDLEVNGRAVAVGEAVKVGDKFGIRVTSMILPEERFLPIGPAK
jgi:flagellar motor switch protein FliN